MPNRLAESTSPYLLQHKDNPVEWWPWSDDAFAEARERDVPVLLSVGYAACHWCHVMAHESFEDIDTAVLMNEKFVCIKVDREERPDVDAVYMEAVQAMTGQGGWPMTAFLTPAAQPFFCGTYFPPASRPGLPGFRQVLVSIDTAWRERRDELEAAGARVVAELSTRTPSAGPPLSEQMLDDAAAALRSAYDDQHGGFGGAPKFPPSMCLEFLLRHAARTGDGLDLVEGTCLAMARGGIYDQLAGGFARYSTDVAWVVPHFEKMLYDNALLLRVYTHLWRQTGSSLGRRIALETAQWLLADLRTPEGGFASALDADTDGEEGLTYVWTPEQVGSYAAAVFTVTPAGTFERGASVLQMLADPPDWDRYRDERARLLALRRQRPQPARDGKVVAAWNGLAIAGLAEAGVLFDRPELVEAARVAAALLVETHVVDGRLRRTSRDGRVGTSAGVLEDYADVAEGLITLYGVTAEPHWLRVAEDLLEVALMHFGDGAGGYYDTAADAEVLVRRPRDPTDNATPSGLSALAGALVSYAAYTGSARHRDAADAALATISALVARHPRFTGWAAAVGEASIAGPLEIAVVGTPDRADTKALARIARLTPSPGAVLAVGAPADDVAAAGVPLLADRRALGGVATAYVCRRFLCGKPTTAPGELAISLSVNTAAHALA